MSAPLRRTAVVVALGLLASGCRFSLQGAPRPGGISGPHYSIEGVFTDVLNLPDGAQVREGDIVVGQVTGISTNDFQAHVKMAVQSRFSLPGGTTAEIRFDTPLGDAFVSLTPPSSATGAPLADGAVLTEQDTSAAPTIEDTLSALSVVLNGGGVQQIHAIVDELNKALAGHQQHAHDLIAHVDALLTTLATHREDINAAITSLQDLATQLSKGSATVSAALAAGAPALTVLADQTQRFTTLITKLSTFSDTTLALAHTSGAATVRDIKTLVPVVNQLVALRSQLAPTMTDLATFERVMQRTAPGAYLQLKVLVDGALGTSGAVPKTPPVYGPAAGLESLMTASLR